MSKGKKIVLWIIGILLTMIIGIVASAYFYFNHLVNKTTKVEINKENIGITEEVEEKLSKYNDTIINIALFGVDADENGVGRSDSIMIATINIKNPQNLLWIFLLLIDIN